MTFRVPIHLVPQVRTLCRVCGRLRTLKSQLPRTLPPIMFSHWPNLTQMLLSSFSTDFQASVFISTLFNFNKNPDKSVYPSLISDQVPHPLPPPRWRLTSLACLQRESVRSAYSTSLLPLMFALRNLPSPDPHPAPWPWTLHLSALCSELTPISLPVQWSPRLSW